MKNILLFVSFVLFLCSCDSIKEQGKDVIYVKTIFDDGLLVYNSSGNPLSCFYLIKMKRGMKIEVESMSVKDIKEVCLHKQYLKLEGLKNSEKECYPSYKSVLNRLDACLYFLSDSIPLDSIMLIDVRIWDLGDVGIRFSYNLEKNKDILKDRTVFDQYSIAINQTSLHNDINRILEKYSMKVDTITSGIEPKGITIPVENFIRNRSVNLKQKMPKMVTDAPITIFLKNKNNVNSYLVK